MSRELTDDALISRAASISWCDMGEEVVVLRVKDQSYYRLQDSARALWIQLEQPRTLGELVAVMGEGYDGSPREIALQTRAFVMQGAELELLTVGRGGD